ncbi:hypothetical protein VI817_001551 [Penicillium citrinum]|nr:hypothetical protein VI817_001551 [Penicillium citrinum]
MSGKYVFTKGLKELRFLFCQTSEQSAATRQAFPSADSDPILPDPTLIPDSLVYTSHSSRQWLSS